MDHGNRGVVVTTLLPPMATHTQVARLLTGLTPELDAIHDTGGVLVVAACQTIREATQAAAARITVLGHHHADTVMLLARTRGEAEQARAQLIREQAWITGNATTTPQRITQAIDLLYATPGVPALHAVDAIHSHIRHLEAQVDALRMLTHEPGEGS